MLYDPKNQQLLFKTINNNNNDNNNSSRKHNSNMKHWKSDFLATRIYFMNAVAPESFPLDAAQILVFL